MAAGATRHPMVVGEAMIVAGLGSRRDVALDEVLDAIRAAAQAHGLSLAEIGTLATGRKKAVERAFQDAARELGIPLKVMSQAALEAVTTRTVTRSRHSMVETGLPSLAETAALAAAGPDATLLGPRIVLGPVTCALARSGDDR